jgi:hypothetical protein
MTANPNVYQISEEDLKALGPLGVLVGEWKGEKGSDVAPSDKDRHQVANSKYMEHMRFEPTGRVDNHEQILYGLRYRTTAWRLGEPNPFHEELGYWMWDQKTKTIIRCFMVPRGVTVLAGGTVSSDAATQWSLAAKVGSAVYGICSNEFLDREFQTVAYELDFTVKDSKTIHYKEITHLKIAGRPAPFAHSDENTLTRVL